MRRVDAAWVGFWVGFGLLDYCADRRGLSLSDTWRHVLHTNTPAGRLTSTALLATGALILHQHLHKPNR